MWTDPQSDQRAFGRSLLRRRVGLSSARSAEGIPITAPAARKTGRRGSERGCRPGRPRGGKARAVLAFKSTWFDSLLEHGRATGRAGTR